MANRENTDLSEEYENFVHTSEYDYGEFFSNIDFAARILNGLSSDHLENGLTNYIMDKHEKDVSDEKRGRSEEKVRRKVRSLVDGNYSKFSYLSDLNSERAFKESVNEAVSRGYIWKFRIDIPWHASFAFDDERISTFPFQHKFMVLYTGQAKHIFFSEHGKWDLLRDDPDVNRNDLEGYRQIGQSICDKTGRSPDEVKEKIEEIAQSIDHEDAKEIAINRLAKQTGVMNEWRNPESVLEQGYLNPGNQHVSGDDDEDYDYKNEKAIWLGFIDKAKNYPAIDKGAQASGNNSPNLYNGSVVFEVEVPTNWLAIRGDNGMKQRIESLKDCKESFGSPENMLSSLDRNNEFVVPSSTNRLPLHYIKGVWDKGKFPQAPHFISLENFVSLMEQEFPRRMPSGKKHIKSGEVSKKELDKIDQKFEIYRKIAKKAGTIETASKNATKFIVKIREFISELEELEWRKDKAKEAKERVSRSENRIRYDNISKTLQDYESKLRYIDRLEDTSNQIRNNLYNRNEAINQLIELFNEASIGVDKSDLEVVDLNEYVELLNEEDQAWPAERMQEYYKKSYEKVARAWENGETEKVEEIISELEERLVRELMNTYRLEFSDENPLYLFQDVIANSSAESLERVEKDIVNGWKESIKQHNSPSKDWTASRST